MTTPRRRWLQFSLATKFTGIAVVCVIVALLGRRIGIVRGRQAALARLTAADGWIVTVTEYQ